MSTLQLRYSRDGGRNWSEWRHIPMGKVGDFQQRVMARRLGRGIRWVFDIRVTDPVRADLLAASIQVEG